MVKRTNYARAIFILLVILSLLAVSAVVKITASFFIPLTVAVLLSFVFYPLCKFLKRIHIPWVLSIVIILAVSFLFLYFTGTLLVASLQTILDAYPRYEARFTSIYKTIAATLNLTFDEDASLITNILNSLNMKSAIQKIAITISSSVMSFSKVMMMITLFIVFLLLEFNSMKEKVNSAFADGHTNKKILYITRNTVSEVTHFISIKFIISLMTGFLVWLGTFLIHMDFPIIWGFIAFILNFIPNFGSTVAWLITTMFATLQFYPNIGYIIYVGIIILLINMVLGNFIEPRWEGNDLGLSPFIILASLSFWGWMWGFVGMIISVPIMVIIKIVCENIDFLKPIAILIGSNKSNRKRYKTFQEEEEEEALNAELLAMQKAEQAAEAVEQVLNTQENLQNTDETRSGTTNNE